MDPNDPNANLFGTDEEVDEAAEFEKQTYGKNPKRADVLGELMYEQMMDYIEQQNVDDEDIKRQMLFRMTVNSVLDMVIDACDESLCQDMTFSLDMFMGVALVNKKYNVNLMKEHSKAMLDVQPSKFNNDEDYQRAMEAFEGEWWDVTQPLLDKRTPNDAIREALQQFGLID